MQTATSAAATANARDAPATIAAPWPATSAPSAATPTAAPTWRAVLRIADAVAERPASTLPSSVDVSAGIAMPPPIAIAASPGASSAYGVCAPSVRHSHT
ncbi:hypothetical protein CSX04_07609 [Burkholderia cepacia]|nr:hypothetical protein CSX04_07609 [Burkholderia cepacia]